jgi:hypothetical protein
MPAANVHRVALAALQTDIIDNFKIGYDESSGFFRDGCGVTQVIAVTVGHKDCVQLCEMVSRDIGLGVSAEERVDEYTMRPIVEFPTIVSVVSKLQHSNISFV